MNSLLLFFYFSGAYLMHEYTELVYDSLGLDFHHLLITTCVIVFWPIFPAVLGIVTFYRWICNLPAL